VDLWRCDGSYVGFRAGDGLWSASGTYLGKCVGPNVFTPMGAYVGEVLPPDRLARDPRKNDQRTTRSSKASSSPHWCPPKGPRSMPRDLLDFPQFNRLLKSDGRRSSDVGNR
jgi:hypothetical protein